MQSVIFISVFTFFFIWKIITWVKSHFKIFSKNLSMKQFLTLWTKQINNGSQIVALGMDRVDGDNFQAALVLLRRLSEIYQKTSNRIPLFIFLTGHPFSTRYGGHIVLPNGNIEYKDKFGEKHEVSPKDFFSPLNIIQEENCAIDNTETMQLLGLYATQLRIFLKHCGFMENCDFFIINGGIPPLHAVNPIMHAPAQFFFNNDELKEGRFKIATNNDIKTDAKKWYDMTYVQRSDYFQEIISNIPAKDMELLSPQVFYDYCQSWSNMFKPITCYGAGPFTPFMSFPLDIAHRVCYFQGMSCAWKGEQNLFGTCFNNIVDMKAFTKTLKIFIYARFVMVPTESCKLPEAIPTLNLLEAIKQLSNNSICANAFIDIGLQWGNYKRSIQAWFDVIAMFDLNLLNICYGLKKASLKLHDNSKFPNHPVIGKIGLTMEDEGTIDSNSPFPPGYYATDADPTTYNNDGIAEYLGSLLK